MSLFGVPKKEKEVKKVFVFFKVVALIIYGCAACCAVIAFFTMMTSPALALAFALIPYAFAHLFALGVRELEGLSQGG